MAPDIYLKRPVASRPTRAVVFRDLLPEVCSCSSLSRNAHLCSTEQQPLQRTDDEVVAAAADFSISNWREALANER